MSAPIGGPPSGAAWGWPVPLKRSESTPGRATASLPGTCGELIQGWSAGGPLLVSCPIDRFATATVDVTDDGRIAAPADRPKARRAAELAIAAWGRPGQGAAVSIQSDLPPSKGYGSSTADIGAVLYALAWALGSRPEPIDIARLAVRIEPTDSTIFPGLTAFDHRTGTRSELIGEAPQLDIAIIDLGGEVDTIHFHRGRSRGRSEGQPAGDPAGAIDPALDLLRRGVSTQVATLIGRAATLSARLHQPVLPKPELEPLIDLVETSGGLGVVVAHSGTLVGLLTGSGADHAAILARQVAGRIGARHPVQVARLINGGVRAAGTSPATP